MGISLYSRIYGLGEQFPEHQQTPHTPTQLIFTGLPHGCLCRKAKGREGLPPAGSYTASLKLCLKSACGYIYMQSRCSRSHSAGTGLLTRSFTTASKAGHPALLSPRSPGCPVCPYSPEVPFLQLLPLVLHCPGVPLDREQDLLHFSTPEPEGRFTPC